MCTVTAFPTGESIIITMNRDEARSKVEDVPQVRPVDKRLNYWYPIDRDSGGTWIGINSVGISAVLLNRYQETNPWASHSRGKLIPTILATKNIKEIELLAAEICWRNYAPCDILVFSLNHWINICWDGESFKTHRNKATVPLIHTSSSENFDETCLWRIQTFNHFLGSQPFSTSALLGFHLSTCSHNPSIGVNMARADRHTKSITQIQLSKGQIKARYFPQKTLDSSLKSIQWDIAWPI